MQIVQTYELFVGALVKWKKGFLLVIGLAKEDINSRLIFCVQLSTGCVHRFNRWLGYT